MEDKIDKVNGIGVAAEKALAFIEKLIAGPIMEGTGIFTDNVKLWRFENQVKIILKAREILKQNNISIPKEIPLKDLSTLLEYASFEEEEIMQDSWANLLANTLDPENEFNACHIFSQVLNQLSINEVKILNYMYSKCFTKSSEYRPYLKRESLIQTGEVAYTTGLLLIDNLIRLRLIEEEPQKLRENDESVFDPFPKQELYSTESFCLSKFGAELVKQIMG